MAVREFPRVDLHREIETPNGRFYRWGKDEPRPENVPANGGFSTTIPGGFDSDNVSLPRKPGVDYSDLARLSTVRAIGAGGEIACETRLKEAPRVSGNQMSIGPASEGWIAHLQDDTTAAEIYRDLDLNSWGSASRAQTELMLKANFPISGSFEVITDVTSALPALHLHVDGFWKEVIPSAQAWYDAGAAARVAKVYTEFAGYADANFILAWISNTADVETGGQASADLYGAPTGTIAAEPSAARRFFAFVWRFSSTPAGIEGAEFGVDLKHVAVEGSHGLSLRGTQPEAGYYASDVIADFLSRWAPLVNFTTGSTGTLRPTSNSIPHLVFKDKTTALAMLEATNAFEGKPYAVWEDRTFHYFDWGDVGRKWRARVGPTELSETGPSIARLRNGVVVEYQDVDGTTKSAGPIGSGCDIEDASLEDDDPENPANQRGIKMYGPPIALGIVSVESIVIRVGALILKRLKETDRSGQMKIVGVCEDDRGVARPAWQVRAGDLITPIDAAEPVERRIIRTDYDEASFTNTITLDAPPDGVPELLAQLGVGIADLNI